MKDLKIQRKSLNKTQKEMAKLLNISESHYCLIENGKRQLAVKNAKLIGKELDFDWTELYE